MNHEAIGRLIDVLKTTPQYDQNLWAFFPPMEYCESVCGTPGCIAGHAIAMKGGTFERSVGRDHRVDSNGNRFRMDTCNIHAQTILGLDSTQAANLFATEPFAYMEDEATVDDAIRTLENLLDTGHVVWIRNAE